MIPKAVIIALDAVTIAFALTAGVGLLARWRRFNRASGGLLLALAVLAVAWGTANVLEWGGILPKADIAEDVFGPLVPVAWLFLFILVPEQQAKQRLRGTVDRLGALHRLATDLVTTTSPQAIMDEVVTEAARLLDLPVVAILTPDDHAGPLKVRASVGMDETTAESLCLEPNRNLSSQALGRGTPLQASLIDGPLPDQTAALVHLYGLTNAAAIPLLADGRALGALAAGRADNRRFADAEIRLLQTLCAHAAGAIQNARLLGRVAESEAKYRAIVENAQAAIIVVDAYRHVLFWNRGAERLFGWAAEEVSDHHVDFIYPEDRRPDVIRHILPALQRDGTWSGEFPAVRKNGETFTAFFSLSRVFDSHGSVICTLGILSDVTERVRLREQLFQAQKMETLGTLAGGIAHDFNNLLTAILGSATLLRDSLTPGSDDYESATSIEQAARRGTQLGEQLMDLSRREPARVEPVNLNPIIREAVRLLRRTLPSQIELVTNLAPHLRSIRGDPGQMHQVLMNLAVNARDAMGQAGTLTIVTENVNLTDDGPFGDGIRPGPGVQLTLSDTGAGVPPDEQAHIFEPFVTTKGNEGGTGLGLSTVYAIVTRHGGRITLESAPGQGATFRILLPAG